MGVKDWIHGLKYGKPLANPKQDYRVIKYFKMNNRGGAKPLCRKK